MPNVCSQLTKVHKKNSKCQVEKKEDENTFTIKVLPEVLKDWGGVFFNFFEKVRMNTVKIILCPVLKLHIRT